MAASTMRRKPALIAEAIESLPARHSQDQARLDE
jgi:hypothetical protein